MLTADRTWTRGLVGTVGFAMRTSDGRRRYAVSLIRTSRQPHYAAAMPGSRILLVDDHAGFRRAAADFLASGGCQVVGTAGSGEEALALLAADGERPDVVLLDCRLPGMDGVAVAERIASLPQPPPVILISSYADAAADPRVGSAAALGFLHKQDLTCPAIMALLA